MARLIISEKRVHMIALDFWQYTLTPIRLKQAIHTVIKSIRFFHQHLESQGRILSAVVLLVTAFGADGDTVG